MGYLNVGCGCSKWCCLYAKMEIYYPKKLLLWLVLVYFLGVIVCFNFWEASAVSVSSFHSTAYVYFDSAFSGSTWREICAQLGFDFEQCQIHLIWMSQMQLGWLKLIEIWRRKCEVKVKSMFRGISYLPTSTDLVMLCDCVAKMWTEG